jgi:predicted dehydrogenase
VKPKLAVIGVGNMGHRHARVVAENPRCELAAVVDVDIERAIAVAESHGTRGATSLDGIDIDAAVLAIPTEYHFDLGLNLINRRIPLLIEKPIAPTFPEAQLMINVGRALDVPIMCGFVERFNPVVTTVKDLLDGPVVHLVATRHSPPADQIRSSVVSDLLIHDIDIAIQLMSDQFGADVLPAVSGSVSRGPRQNSWGEIADCTLSFPDGSMATFSASRVSQRKIRTMSVCTERSLFEIDLLRQDITVYRHVNHELPGSTPGYRSETIIEIPFVRASGEPLASQLDRFVDMIEGKVDLENERASMTVAHQVAHAVDALIQTPAPNQSVSGMDESLTYIDDRVAAVVGAGVVELEGMRQVRLLDAHAGDAGYADLASSVEKGTEVRFEIDFEASRRGPMLAGRLYRKADGLPIVNVA